MTEEITLDESRRLVELERKIKTGLNKFIEVRDALLVMRNRKGYIALGYASFEAYCEKEFNKSAQAISAILDIL